MIRCGMAACQPILSHFKQENRIQLGQNPGRRTKPKKVDGEGAKMRSDIELFEARLAQRNVNEEQKPLDGPEYMAKIKSEAAENRQKANERNQRRRKVLVETIKEPFFLIDHFIDTSREYKISYKS